MSLSETLTKRYIREKAGSKSYERGETYFLTDHVSHLLDRNGKITAIVHGTHDYRVRLWADENELGYACDCPVGLRDEFCKHCVAVALQWLQQNDESSYDTNSAGKATKPPDCRAWLMKQDKATLVNLLLEEAELNEELHSRLLFGAAAAATDFELATHKKIIRQAIDCSEFVEYGDVYDYWRRAYTVIDGIEALLDQDRAEAVIELCEYALRRVEQAIEHVDDSDGSMGELLDRLQDIHLTACKAAKPDLRALAKRLFDWELNGDWDTFRGAAVTYAEVLGDKGLKHYRELAEAAWAAVPPLGPGNGDAESYRHFNIKYIMETLAQTGGGLDELIAVKQRDLSSSYTFFEIAQACRQAGAEDRALAWAEKGLAAFGEETDSRLINLLAELYHGLNRHDDAVNLIWLQFEQAPSLETYEQLKQAAEQQQRWSAWRNRALKFIREEIQQQAAGKRSRRRSFYDSWSDHSLLVQIALWEGNVERAWREARDGGCTEDLWLELARRREKQHPRDAISIYQRQVDRCVERTNNNAYAEAIVVIRRIKKLMAESGDGMEFQRYLDMLRANFKPKRNFMKMLDEFRR